MSPDFFHNFMAACSGILIGNGLAVVAIGYIERTKFLLIPGLFILAAGFGLMMAI